MVVPDRLLCASPSSPRSQSPGRVGSCSSQATPRNGVPGGSRSLPSDWPLTSTQGSGFGPRAQCKPGWERPTVPLEGPTAWCPCQWSLDHLPQFHPHWSHSLSPGPLQPALASECLRASRKLGFPRLFGAMLTVKLGHSPVGLAKGKRGLARSPPWSSPNVWHKPRHSQPPTTSGLGTLLPSVGTQAGGWLISEPRAHQGKGTLLSLGQRASVFGFTKDRASQLA